MQDEVERIVIESVARQKALNPLTVSADSALADLGIDSLDGLELMFSLEDRFKITIPDDVGRNMKTVRDVVDGLRRLKPDLTAG